MLRCVMVVMVIEISPCARNLALACQHFSKVRSHRPTCCQLVHGDVESKLLATGGVHPRRRWHIQRVMTMLISNSEGWSAAVGGDGAARCCCSTSSTDATKLFRCAVLPQSTPSSSCSLSEGLVTNRCVPRAKNCREHWMEYAWESANKLASTTACGITPMLQQSRMFGLWAGVTYKRYAETRLLWEVITSAQSD